MPVQNYVFLSIVRSIFEHFSVIWSPQSISHIAKFDALQKRAIKMIDGHPFNSYTAEEFLNKQREYNLLPMYSKFKFNDLKLSYQIVNNLIPISLPDYIVIVEAEQVRYTRSTSAIVDQIDASTYCCCVVPRCDSFRHSYFYQTMKNWNALPVSVRQSSCISIFKSKLISHLWSADTDWQD